MFARYGILDKIILDRDMRFILVYWQVFTAEQGVRIVVLIVYYPQIDNQIKRLN